MPNLEITRMDVGVVDTQNHVDILHRLSFDICQLLDLGSGVLDL